MDENEINIIKKQIAEHWEKYVQYKKEYDIVEMEYKDCRVKALTENTDSMFIDFNANVVTSKIKLDAALNNWKIVGYKEQVEMWWNLINQNNSTSETTNNNTNDTSNTFTEEDINRLKELWTAYQQKKQAYEVAATTLETAKTNAVAMQSSAAIHDYAVNATTYKNQAETAMQDWIINGNKEEVELLLQKGTPIN